MRKRKPSDRAATVTTLLTAALVALFVAGCDRTSDTTRASAVGSPDGAGVNVASGNPGPATPMRAQMGRSASAIAEAAAPNASATDTRAVNLGGATQLGAPLPDAGAMLIRNGHATVKVAHLDDGVTRLRQMAVQLGGFVANTAIVGGNDEHRSATLEIRVPSAQFDAVVSALSGLGTVESVSVAVQDVGDEYVDLRARAANARHMEARLVEMLAQRTGRLSDALTVEQELRRVREEVERYEARLNWLERRTALSSLEIAVHEPLSVLDQRGPSPIAEAFGEAWRRAVGVLAWCIASLGVIVPVGLLIGAIVLVALKLPRRTRPTPVA